MDTDKINIFVCSVNVDFIAKLAKIEQAGMKKKWRKVGHILKHGMNCFINRHLMYTFPDQLFEAAGVMAIEHIEHLALVTGGKLPLTLTSQN